MPGHTKKPMMKKKKKKSGKRKSKSRGKMASIFQGHI